MTSLLFWDVTKRGLVVIYRSFGTNHRSHLPGSSKTWTTWPLKMGLMRCPETSVTNCQSTLHSISEERRSFPSSLTIRFLIILKAWFFYRMSSLNLLQCFIINIPRCITSEFAPITSFCFRSCWQALITSATHWCIAFPISTWQVYWLIMNVRQLDDCQNISVLKTCFGAILQQTISLNSILLTRYIFIQWHWHVRSKKKDQYVLF